MKRATAGWLLAATLAGPTVAHARDVSADEPAFHARIPDAFAPMEGTRAGVQLFVSPGSPGAPPRSITFRPMEGPLAQDALDASMLRELVAQSSPGAQVNVTSARALGVEVPLVVGRNAGRDALAIAQIPSEPRGVQLIVTGPAQDAAGIERIARDVMGSMTGRTRWLTQTQKIERTVSRVLVYAAWLALGLYAIAWAARFRARPEARTQRWLLLATGLLFAGSAAILALVPRDARLFDPITPALVAAVLIANAWLTRSTVRSAPPG